MNKKLFFGLVATFAVAIAAVCVSVSNVNSTSQMSDLMTKNLEVLARQEGTSYTCVKSGDYKQGVQTFMCDICDWNPNTAKSFWSQSGTCTK